MTELQIETNRRKRFVRRCYKKSPLWVIEYVRERYQYYEPAMLIDDLRIRYKRKNKFEKHTRWPEDFRSCQIRKYVTRMESSDRESVEYHKACIMISRLNEAHIKRKDIYLTIRINNQSIRYGFKWNSTEKFIKHVASLNLVSSTFEEFENKLEDLYKQLGAFGK